MSLDYFLDNTDYTLRWPPELFAREVQRVTTRASQFAQSKTWREEVEHLLGEAFTSLAVFRDYRGLSSDRNELQWLNELADAAPLLPREGPVRPYFSQRRSPREAATEPALPEVVLRVRRLIQKFLDDHYFAQEIGFDCVDGHGDFGTAPRHHLEERVGKPMLWVDDVAEWDGEHPWALEPHDWTTDDLCDFIEVFHDLASRPTRGWHHSFNDCGWHPSDFAQPIGQALYRSRINELLEDVQFAFRLADSGEDVGRMVRAMPDELDDVVADVLESRAPHRDQAAHAIALYRTRNGTLEDRRSAVVSLCGILEENRELLKGAIQRPGEAALFEIANKFHLRHQNASQHKDYAPVYLDWIFCWYLATIRLIDQLLAEAADAA